MKYGKILCILVVGIIFSLLMVVLPVAPTYAAGGVIKLHPNEGKIGDTIEINGYSFDADKAVRLYFSSDKVDEGASIDYKVTAYEYIGMVSINADGDFSTGFNFRVPDELTDGSEREYVHGGHYYVYVVYYGQQTISAIDRFTVINGEIQVEPQQGRVGTKINISGDGLHDNQKITIEYDGEDVDITSGDEQTDSNGKFSCIIVIPESTSGNHTIRVTDEVGNKPETEFSVEPSISIDPTSQAVGETVDISGTGFGKRENITIVFEGLGEVATLRPIRTTRRGSLTGSFVVPSDADCTTCKIEAHDESSNVAKAQLATFILPTPTIPAGIGLAPATSVTSPGHVSMELTVTGSGFTANTMVTVTYDNGQTPTVTTITTDTNGDFLATFTVPPSIAGSHTVSATDGANMATDVFTMESEAPPMPVPLLPEVATTTKAKAYFDWEGVTDPSGITYTLQIGSDADFTTIVLEEAGLSNSEYTLDEEDRLETTDREAPYYWRVKAVDGASNESQWTPSVLFYVGFSWAALPDWVRYTFYGLGVLLLAALVFEVRRRATSH